MLVCIISLMKRPELVITIVYINDVCFIGSKHFLLLYKIFVDQSEYLNKVLACFNIATNPTSTSLPLYYVFKPNDKQYNSSFCQKY